MTYDFFNSNMKSQIKHQTYTINYLRYKKKRKTNIPSVVMKAPKAWLGGEYPTFWEG